jgi:Mg-chelatase subunit ChlD
LTAELVRLWEFDPLVPIECPVDPPGYNLSADQLALIRGRTIALVLHLNKVSLPWETGVVLDGVHFAICAPTPPCRVVGNKTAAPSSVPPGGETTVTLSLTGLDGACLPQRQPADVVLVVDSSGSMEGQPLGDAKAAAMGFLDRLDPARDQSAVVSFSDTAALNQGLGAEIGPPRAAIGALTAGGGTNMADGLERGRAELAGPRHRPASRPILVLLSDGRPTAGGDPLVPAAAAKAAGMRLITIGLGNDVDPELLRAVASTAGDYFFAPDSSRLDTIFQQIAGLIDGSPATDVVLVDRLSPYVTLVPGSFTGSPSPEVSADGRTLTWRLPRLGLETRIFTYRVRMTTTPGLWPVNDAANVTYTDSVGHSAGFALPNPQVRVEQPTDTHPEVTCRDRDGDDGTVPSNRLGEAWWASPDIWVRHQRDGLSEHQNPIVGQSNYVYVRVRNIGSGEARDVTVRVYDAQGATNLRWPDDWAPEVGRATVTRVAPGATEVVAVQWVPAYTGHYCFLVRLDATGDPITFDGWVPFDNNICQRNVQILAPDSSGSSTTGVGVGMRERGHGYGSVHVDSTNMPLGGSGRVLFHDPSLFERWRSAGGTATGGVIDPVNHAVVMNIVPSAGAARASQAAAVGSVALVLERLPFEAEELSTIQLALAVPSGAVQPLLMIEQRIDGRVVGGNIVRPAALPRIYLPAVLQAGVLGAATP